MLDTVINPERAGVLLHYSKETNSYRSAEGPNEARSDGMGANLTDIDYGWAEQLPRIATFLQPIHGQLQPFCKQHHGPFG